MGFLLIRPVDRSHVRSLTWRPEGKPSYVGAGDTESSWFRKQALLLRPIVVAEGRAGEEVARLRRGAKERRREEGTWCSRRSCTRRSRGRWRELRGRGRSPPSRRRESSASPSSSSPAITSSPSAPPGPGMFCLSPVF